MLQFTLECGRVVQRVFAGNVTTPSELDSLIKELRAEVAANETGNSLMIEIWQDVTPKKEVVKSRRKMVFVS